MEKSIKQRDYLFDNYKVLLIFLVVVGHLIGPSRNENSFLLNLKWLIVSFHMPAFIFISGYFSKKGCSFLACVKKLAVPYVVYQILYHLLYTAILKKPVTFELLYPNFSLWYLLALFIWKWITPYVRKIPGHLILSIAAGLLIGCSGMDDNYISIPRILVFYPYFLMGVHFNRESLKKFQTGKWKLAAVLSIAAVFLFILYGPLKQMYSMTIFYGRYNYKFLNQGILDGIFCRIMCYFIGTFLTFSLLVLMSEKKFAFSYIGTRTMSIYLFHGLFYCWFKDSSQILYCIDTLWETCLLLGGCALLTWILSFHPLTVLTNKVANIPFEKLKIEYKTYSFIEGCFI